MVARNRRKRNSEFAAELSTHLKNAADRIDVDELIRPERALLSGKPAAIGGNELQSAIDGFRE